MARKRVVCVTPLMACLCALDANSTKEHGATQVEADGAVVYTPYEWGEHSVAFGERGSLRFDATGVVTDKVAKGLLRSTEAGKASVFGAAIEVRSRPATVGDFPVREQRFTAAEKAYMFEPEGLVFSKAAVLTLPYSSIEGIEDKYIDIYYYNKERARWEYIPKISQDTEKKTITAEIRHFSTYVVGMSSFRIDEGESIDGGGQLSHDIDPYYGTLILKSEEVNIPARGVDLKLSARFNSDYLYAKYVPHFQGTETTAGQTMVSHSMGVAYPWAMFSGWSYEIPHCLFNAANVCTLTLPSGAKYDLSYCLFAWAYYMPVGASGIYGGYHLYKPDGNHLYAIIPTAKYGLYITLSGDSDNVQVSAVKVYNADGSYWDFPGSGNAQYLYDASGKNRLHYVYEFSGLFLQKIEHSDGRAIKIYRYVHSDGMRSLVYVLSSSWNMGVLNEGDQFLERRVFDSSLQLRYADKLQTNGGWNPVASGWGGVTASNESSYFSMLQRTSYDYNLTSTVTGNTICIAEPGGGTRTYTFAPSFGPGMVATTVYTEIDPSWDPPDPPDPPRPGWHPPTAPTITHYTRCYQNKPKVRWVEILETSSGSLWKKITKDYRYASNCNIDVFDAGSIQTSITSLPELWNTMPSSSTITQGLVIWNRPTTPIPIAQEILAYAHAGNTTDTYQGISFDETKIYDSSGWVSKTKNVTTSWEHYYCAYFPTTIVTYKDGATAPTWTTTNTYGLYQRLIKQMDSRTGGWNHWYYLFDGQPLDSGISYPFTIPGTGNAYTAFGLLGGTASKQSDTVTSMAYLGYDASLNLTTHRVLDTRSGAAVTRDTGYTYDATTNVLTGITEPLGNTLSLSYGAGWKSSYVTQSSRVLEGTTKTVNVFDYDLRGRTTSESSKLVDGNNSDIVDPTAPITTRGYVYDGLSRITRKTLTTGGVTNTLYKRDFNDSALTVTTTDAKGYRTVASYDSFFRKVLEERFRPNTENQNAEYDGTGQVSVGKMSWSYNPAHRNKVSQEKVYGAPDGSIWYGTGYWYDNLGRVIQVNRGDQDGYQKTEEYEYDDSTNTITEKRYRDGNVYTQMVTAKNWLDWVLSVTEYAGTNGGGTPSVTSTAYNYVGQPVVKTLANGEQYTYNYSKAGLLESMGYPQGRGTESYVYDNNGRLVTRTDAGGNVTSYTYNPADMEVSRVSSAPGKDPIVVVTSYSQYGPKQVTQTRAGVQDIQVQYEYSYNNGALTRTERRSIAGAGTGIVAHGYDAAGNLRTLSVTGFDGSFAKTLDYSLPYFGGDGSASDRNVKVSMGGSLLGKVSTYYAGVRDTVTYGSGVTTSHTNYDALLRPLGIDHPGTEYDQTYGYDLQGNITTWNGTAYAYDGKDQLTTGGYTYDKIRNQTAGPEGTSYTYVPIGNLPTMRLSTKVSGAETTTYTDDGHLGNLVAVSGKYTGLIYDATNRLIQLTDVGRGGLLDRYRYGPEGLRYKREEASNSGSSTTTYYLYEGNDILYEEGYEGSTRSFCKLNVYVGGLNIGRVKKEGSMERVQYFYTDHLGSRRGVTDASGVVQAKIVYDVWGLATVTNHGGYEGTRDISYTGKERDSTGLYYFNARYYDAGIGRFITEDPARHGVNWFVYCNNNPLRYTDPTGLAPVICDDINGQPVVAIPGKDIKSETYIEVVRNVDPQSYQGNNPPKFYQDANSIKIRGQTIYKIDSQASASAKGPYAYGVKVENLVEGQHTGTLESKSGSGFYINVIRVDESEILMHPNKKTAIVGSSEWNTPCSAGCNVSKTKDFDGMVSQLQGLGFEYNDRSSGVANLDTIIIYYIKNY